MRDRLNARIVRAEENVRNLDREVTTFLAGSPYYSVQHDEANGDRVWSLKINSEIPLAFSVLVGEIIHDLRSTLDHMIYHLVLQNGGTPTFSTAFPIYDSAMDFKKDGKSKIKGVSSQVAHVVDTTKPYKNGNDALYQLHRLSIIDKHRAPLLLGATATPKLRATVGKPVSYKHLFPPFEDGMPLLRANKVAGQQDVNLEAEFAFYITVRERGFAIGESLIPAMCRLAVVVRDTVTLFDGFL